GNGYSATINWGDGQVSSGGQIIALGNGQWSVQGTHTYGTQGTYTISIQIADADGTQATATSTAQVTAPQPIYVSLQRLYSAADMLTTSDESYGDLVTTARSEERRVGKDC